MRDAELKQVERDNILAALRQAGWQIDGQGGAAALLELKPSTLRSRMKSLGLSKP